MTKIRRPWGWYIVLLESRLSWWVKLIRVEGRTSLQTHRHRGEIHIGTGGIKHFRRREQHRLERGWYIEIAYGTPFEHDIFRYADDYGRVS